MAKESNLIDLKRKMRNEHENYTLDGDSLRHDYRPWVNKVSLKLYIDSSGTLGYSLTSGRALKVIGVELELFHNSFLDLL